MYLCSTSLYGVVTRMIYILTSRSSAMVLHLPSWISMRQRLDGSISSDCSSRFSLPKARWMSAASMTTTTASINS